MKFDRDKFFDAYRKQFGTITQAQVNALNALLDAIEDDTQIDDLRHIAYILSTIKHETAHTFEPIEEYGKGKGHSYGVKDKETGFAYFGRGLVQLTWRKNYEKLGERLGVDLVNNPDLALEPNIAWQITSEGMRHGLFTGKDLDDYIHGSKCDYVNARKIINRLDQAERIARYARQFEAILKASSLERAGLSVSDDIPEQVLQTSSPDAPLAEEAKDTTSLTLKDGELKAEINVTPKEPERVVIEKPEPVGFIKGIKKKLGIAGGTNLGIQALRDQFDTAKGFGFSPRFWMWVSIIGVVGAAIWLAIEWFHNWQGNKRELAITDALIKANTTPENQVELLSKEEIEKLSEKKGVKIVRR